MLKNYDLMVAEAKSLRKITIYANIIAVFATIMSIVFVPTLYNYTQYIQSTIQDEIIFCKHRTQKLYSQFEKVIILLF